MSKEIAIKKEPATNKNVNRVPTLVWRGWSQKARRLFNATYDVMMENQSLFLHPKMQKPKPHEWKALCWNAAWVVADAHDGTIPDKVIEG